MNLKVAFSLIIFALLANGQYWRGDLLDMQSTFIADVAGSSNITLEWASGYEANATLWFFTPLSNISSILISDGYEIHSDYQQQYGLRRATDDSSVLIIHQLSNVTEGTYICRSHGIFNSSLLLTIPFTMSMEPLFGPIAGGTNITIIGSATIDYLSKYVGRYLPEITGFRNVYIGSDLSATSVSLLPNGSSTFDVVAVSPKTTESSIGQPLPVIIEFLPTPFNMTFNRAFTYLPNPEITGIFQNNFIVADGKLLDVTGRSLSSVAKPIIQLTVIITRAEDNSSTSIASTTSSSRVCTVQPGNDTFMQCPIPPLNLPDDFLEALNSQYNTNTSRRRLSINPSHEFMANSHRLLSRMKRDRPTKCGPNGTDCANIYLGFIFDGYKAYENINDTLPDTTFIFYSDPEINSSDALIDFDPFEDELIYVKGRNMLRGCRIEDYVVHIGNQICINNDLQDSQLSCRPPKEKPSSTMNDTIYCGQYLRITITLGYKQYPYACLSYTDHSKKFADGLSDGGKIGFGVGIGVGGMLVLVGILFAVLCRRYEWTKRIKTDDKKTIGMEEDSEKSRAHGENSNTPQYEPLNVLSAQNLNAGPTYAQLSPSTNVDVLEQSPTDRETEYEGLQQRERLPSDAYESIRSIII